MYEGIARDYTIAERFDDALRVCERGVDLAQAFGMPKERCLLLSASSEPLRFRGDLDEALTAAHRAVMLMNPNSDAVDTSNFVLTLWREGLVLGEDGGISLARSEEAVRVLQRGFDLMDPFVHRDGSDESNVERLELVGTALADILRHANARRALAIYDHTLGHVKDIDSRTMRRAEVTLLAGSSYALTTLGRRLKARQQLDAAFAVLAELKLYPSDRVVTGSEAERALCALAEYEESAGNTALAIGTYTDLLRRMHASGGKPQEILRHAVEFSNIWASMAVLYRRAGNPTLASDLESRRLNLWRLWDHKLPHNSFVDRQLRAAALLRKG
jgi:tetratricopeptide (TPR) repeat protein